MIVISNEISTLVSYLYWVSIKFHFCIAFELYIYCIGDKLFFHLFWELIYNYQEHDIETQGTILNAT